MCCVCRARAMRRLNILMYDQSMLRGEHIAPSRSIGGRGGGGKRD